MAFVGDAHVTEVLTPSVNLTAALLTPHFLQVAVQIQDPHLQRSGKESFTSSCRFSQKAWTKHICTVTATCCYRPLQSNPGFGSQNTSKELFGCLERVVKNLRGKLANSSNVTLGPSTLYWILIGECSQFQACIQSKQMMDGAPTGLSLSSLSLCFIQIWANDLYLDYFLRLIVI